MMILLAETLTISSTIKTQRLIMRITITPKSWYAFSYFDNVQDIMRELAPFEWGHSSDDGIKRIKRPILLLENGAKYEGEW